MGGAPSRTTTVQNPNLPPEVSRLIGIGGDQTAAGLGMSPITDFLNPMIRPVAGPDPATLQALAYYQSLAGGSATPGILDAFQRLQMPLIQDQAQAAGLGRSGAYTDALAQGQAASIMQALQLQSQAAGAEAGLGDYLRQISEQQLSAPYEDYLRRQGITESLLSGATGLIPSSIGQRGTQNNQSAGLMGWLFGNMSGLPIPGGSK